MAGRSPSCRAARRTSACSFRRERDGRRTPAGGIADRRSRCTTRTGGDAGRSRTVALAARTRPLAQGEGIRSVAGPLGEGPYVRVMGAGRAGALFAP